MNVYTTGQCARFCRVAPRTFAKWFDSGYFTTGYRIPGSRDRRLPDKELRTFMVEHSIPTDLLDEYESNPGRVTRCRERAAGAG